MILCIRRDPKFGVRSSKNLELLLVPRFAPFTLFSRWE
jgi:hypothetical protein